MSDSCAKEQHVTGVRVKSDRTSGVMSAWRKVRPSWGNQEAVHNWLNRPKTTHVIARTSLISLREGRPNQWVSSLCTLTWHLMASVVGLHMDAHFLSQVDADVWLLWVFSLLFSQSQLGVVICALLRPWVAALCSLRASLCGWKEYCTKHFREPRTPDVQCCTDVIFVICHVLSYFQGWVVCVVLSIKSGFSHSKCRIWSTSLDNKHSNCIMCCITWVEVWRHFVTFSKIIDQQNGPFECA